MSKKPIIAVLGAGNMGTAIAQVVAKNGYKVNLWNYEGDPQPLKQILQERENKKYLPGFKLSGNINPQPDIAKAVRDAKVIFFVVPSFFVESIVKRVAPYLRHQAVCVDASKGLDEKSLGLVPDIIRKNLPPALHGSVATISGPAIATSMAEGGFTAMDIASQSKNSIKIVKAIMENNHLKLKASHDIVGVELTGSFKNVYAIAMGLCDGFKMPMNTKAALLVVALREISLLVEKKGGCSETVYGLSGLGDLVGTGLCAASRNRRFGEFLARGLTIKAALAKVGQVVEGIRAAKVLHALGKKYGIATPFAEMVYKVVSGAVSPRTALNKFLQNLP